MVLDFLSIVKLVYQISYLIGLFLTCFLLSFSLFGFTRTPTVNEVQVI